MTGPRHSHTSLGAHARVGLACLGLTACAPSEAELAAAVASRFPGQAIVRADTSANFFGRTTAGAAQLRGNGVLVLVDSALWFQQYVPERELTIPLADIRALDLVDAHLGKSVGRALLLVRFRDAAGDDSAAWYVADPEGWRAAIAGRLSPGTDDTTPAGLSPPRP